jgi:uncharacterized membrane protein YphA (DoxX/SURF4 family)
MKRFTVARLLLGLIFLVFGFDGLLHFLPMPPMPDDAVRVIGVLIGYRLFYAVKAIEIAAAVMLLTGRYTTLALALLAPVIFNIVWFDAHLAPMGLPVGVLLVGLEAALLWQQRDRFLPLLSAR